MTPTNLNPYVCAFDPWMPKADIEVGEAGRRRRQHLCTVYPIFKQMLKWFDQNSFSCLRSSANFVDGFTIAFHLCMQSLSITVSRCCRAHFASSATLRKSNIS